MDIKLAYGIKEGQVVHISEIRPAEKGEKCNCTCPACGEVLVAKLGNKNQHHFAHKASSNCDIVHAQETGLHKLAKQIIQENQSILVPGFSISRQEIVPERICNSIDSEIYIDLPNISSQKVEYSSVDIEKPIEDIVADAVIEVQGIQCIVEIYVTNPVDENKIKKIKRIGKSAFEINLRDLLKKYSTREDIAKTVLFDETNRHWVFNGKREQILSKKKSEYLDAGQKIKQDKKREIQEYLSSDNYKRELNRLRNRDDASKWLKCFDFSKGLSEYPFYTDIPITGEPVFSCDRRIWQGKLFDDYVYVQDEKGHNEFSIREIQNRLLTEKNKIFHYAEEKDYPETIILNGKKQNSSFLFDVLQRYFEYLELLGFVYHRGTKWYSKRTLSIDAPKKTAANILEDVLKSVGKSSSYINQIIKNELLSRLEEKDREIVLNWYETY